MYENFLYKRENFFFGFRQTKEEEKNSECDGENLCANRERKIQMNHRTLHGKLNEKIVEEKPIFFPDIFSSIRKKRLIILDFIIYY